jgi:1-deoxy-D-xylulose-5-phosphate reductoisomerase
MGDFEEILRVGAGAEKFLEFGSGVGQEAERATLKQISILGSTGSIGRQTLAVVEAMPERFAVVALAAGNNVEELAQQISRHHPELVSVATPAAAASLAKRLSAAGAERLPDIHHGAEGMRAVATHPSTKILVSAAVGVVGLEATYAAVKAGKQVALSNKEVLVAAGEIVMAAARQAGVDLLPVDSEHNAIHQCLRAGQHGEVKKLILTASGGPFRKTPLAKMAAATPEQALAHPNWRMGRRITIDSATLVNKGFEVIEARWLFDMRPDQIEVVVHPQSTVHSMVEYVDGSILAQLGPTDMRMPIQYALTYPERSASNEVALDWSKLRRLDFEKVSTRRFPCLRLAREALRKMGPYPCAFNAADEIAVEAFLDRRIPFSGIAEVIEGVLERTPGIKMSVIADVLAADSDARRMAREEVERKVARSAVA